MIWTKILAVIFLNLLMTLKYFADFQKFGTVRFYKRSGIITEIVRRVANPV